MDICIERRYFCDDYTIGRLLVNGSYFCDTMEPADRGLDASMKVTDIRAAKAAGATAIPTGHYVLVMNVVSPRLREQKAYRFCNGLVPRFLLVPGFDGVLIHAGNFPEDTKGCVLVGRNLVKGQLLDSAITFRRLYERLKQADSRGESLLVEVTRRTAKRLPLRRDLC